MLFIIQRIIQVGLSEQVDSLEAEVAHLRRQLFAASEEKLGSIGSIAPMGEAIRRRLDEEGGFHDRHRPPPVNGSPPAGGRGRRRPDLVPLDLQRLRLSDKLLESVGGSVGALQGGMSAASPLFSEDLGPPSPLPSLSQSPLASRFAGPGGSGDDDAAMSLLQASLQARVDKVRGNWLGVAGVA